MTSDFSAIYEFMIQKMCVKWQSNENIFDEIFNIKSEEETEYDIDSSFYMKNEGQLFSSQKGTSENHLKHNAFIEISFSLLILSNSCIKYNGTSANTMLYICGSFLALNLLCFSNHHII